MKLEVKSITAVAAELGVDLQSQQNGVTPLAVPGLEPFGCVTPELVGVLEGILSTLEFGGVTPEATGKLPGKLEFGAVTLLTITEFKAGGVMDTGALNAVELEKSAGVVVGVELEVVVSGVGLLEGERFVVVTPKAGVLTLEVEAVVMAVLEEETETQSRLRILEFHYLDARESLMIVYAR